MLTDQKEFEGNNFLVGEVRGRGRGSKEVEDKTISSRSLDGTLSWPSSMERQSATSASSGERMAWVKFGIEVALAVAAVYMMKTYIAGKFSNAHEDIDIHTTCNCLVLLAESFFVFWLSF